MRAKHIARQIDQLLDVIRLGDWQGPDKLLMDTYKENLCGHKRKLVEDNERVGEEMHKLREERRKFDDYKISEMAKLRKMMDDLKNQQQTQEPKYADSDDSVQFIGIDVPPMQLPHQAPKRRRAEPVRNDDDVEPDDVPPS
jgi:hypothetical protein